MEALAARPGFCRSAGLALGLVLLLGGCSSDWMEARERAQLANVPPPPTYRADIVALMRTYLNNPIGVRDAYVSEPALRTLGAPMCLVQAMAIGLDLAAD